MLAIERRNIILEKLQREKRVVVSQLSQEFEVSEETIRRDLEKFEQEGIAVKSYGGAVLNEDDSIDLPFNIRKNRNVGGKQKIATCIAEMIQDGERIMLDASSTAVYIAKALKGKKNLTVITNSIEIVIELLDQPDWKIIATGGTAKAGSFAMVGPNAEKILKTYHVDKAVISCKGLDIEQGFTDNDEEHAANKHTMLSAAVQKILVADGTKFGEIAFARVGGLDEIDVLVTDENPGGEWLQSLEKIGVQCVYPE